jgi:hypothetical protein
MFSLVSIRNIPRFAMSASKLVEVDDPRDVFRSGRIFYLKRFKVLDLADTEYLDVSESNDSMGTKESLNPE